MAQNDSLVVPVATVSRAREGVRCLVVRLLPFVPPLVLLAGIRAFAVNVPYWDEWDLIPFVVGLHDGTLTFSDFWMQHNEHRIVAVKLIMSPLVLATDFDVTAHMYAGFALQFMAFVFLWSMLALTLRECYPQLITPLAIILGLLLFSPAQDETWLFGEVSLQWYLSNLAAVAAIWVLTRWPWRWFALPIVFFLACAGMLALASGMMIWGMVLVAIVTQSVMQGTRPLLNWLLAWATGTLVLAAGYFAGFQSTVVAPDVFFFLTDPLKFVAFVFVYLGSPLAQGGSLWVAGVVGLGGLVLLAAVLFVAYQGPLGAQPILPWFWLCAYALLVSVAIAVGRVESGVVMATATRYTTGSLLFWVGLAVTTAVALKKLASSRPLMARRLQLWVLALLIACGVDYVRLYYNGYRAFVKSKKDRTLGLAELYEYDTVQDGALTLLHPNTKRTRDYARELEHRGLGPFAARMSQERRRLDDVLTVAEKIISGQGFLDVVQCGIIAGWASDREQPDVAVKVDVYDGEVLLATLPANRFRWDLVDAGIGNGSHGFSYAPPGEVKDGRVHLVRVRISGTDIDLSGTPKPLTCK